MQVPYKKHENKFPIKVSCFVASLIKQFPLPTQYRPSPMTHYMFQSNASTTAVQNHEYYLMHLRIKTNIPKQSNKVHPGHSYSQSVVNQQPQHQVPLCLQCHDGSYFSLSALQYLNCQAKPNCFRLQSQGHQSVQTSVKPHCSCTLSNLRCSTTHIFISQMWQINQGH